MQLNFFSFVTEIVFCYNYVRLVQLFLKAKGPLAVTA